MQVISEIDSLGADEPRSRRRRASRGLSLLGETKKTLKTINKHLQPCWVSGIVHRQLNIGVKT